MKKETKNRIIKWSLYALLVIATVLIFAFNKEIFGLNYHKELDVNGDATGKMIWAKGCRCIRSYILRKAS